MPRDGSNVYHYPPGIEGVTDQVIESADYNSFISDVEQDLNLPRPIIAGGTGASNSSDAMNSLGGEVSKIQVTNYDSHDFKAGSFYSGTSATNSPVIGHAFAGVCYSAVVGAVATTDMFIEARDMDDASSPPTVYVRQKKTNVWGGWMVPAVGGANPSFSGVISLNGSAILAMGNTAFGTGNQLLNPTTTPGTKAGVAVAGPTTTYNNDTHTFKNNIGATQYVEFRSTAAEFAIPIQAGQITCTAPALNDSSLRVPTTAWVNDAVTNSIVSTPDFPQVLTTAAAYTINQTDIGKHIFRPVGASAVVVSLINDFSSSYPIGTMIMFVNFGGPMTITPNVANTRMYLAGTTSSGSRTLAGGSTPSVATILKVAQGPTFGDYIIWGHGLT